MVRQPEPPRSGPERGPRLGPGDPAALPPSARPRPAPDSAPGLRPSAPSAPRLRLRTPPLRPAGAGPRDPEDPPTSRAGGGGPRPALPASWTLLIHEMKPRTILPRATSQTAGRARKASAPLPGSGGSRAPHAPGADPHAQEVGGGGGGGSRGPLGAAPALLAQPPCSQAGDRSSGLGWRPVPGRAAAGGRSALAPSGLGSVGRCFPGRPARRGPLPGVGSQAGARGPGGAGRYLPGPLCPRVLTLSLLPGPAAFTTPTSSAVSADVSAKAP